MVRPLTNGSLLNACTCALRQSTLSSTSSRPLLPARPSLASAFSTSLATRIDLSDLDTFVPNQLNQPKQHKQSSPSPSSSSIRPAPRSTRAKPPPLSPAERAAELDRREALHKDRLAKRAGITPERQYALQRERERIYNSNLDKRHPKEAERLLRSAKAVGAGAVLRQRGQGLGQGQGQGQGARDGQRGARYDGRGGSGGGGGRGGDAVKGMVPGMVNLGTRVRGPRRDEVKAVVRGGAPRNSGGGGAGQRGRRQKKELKKVTLPSTIRLENLTNLLGVKLCKL